MKVTLIASLICTVIAILCGFHISQLETSPITALSQIRHKPSGYTLGDRLHAEEETVTFLNRQLAYAKREKAHYPVVDLDGRLKYEDDALRQFTTDELAMQLETTLAREETLYDSLKPYRVSYLKYLHEQVTDEFIARNGFGVYRAPVIRDDERLALSIPMIPMAARHEAKNAGSKSGVTSDELLPAFEQMNQHTVRDFVRPASIGYQPDFRQFAAFLPHHLTQHPHIVDSSKDTTLADWQFTNVELVSMWKYALPMAYISSSLPRLDLLSAAETRPLTEFERTGLEQLESSVDIVISGDDYHIVAIGAIRARSECLSCHSVKRGDMLGAFSYRFDRRRHTSVADLPSKATGSHLID